MFKFLSAEIDTYLPIRFVLCTETDMLSIQKEENITKLRVNNNINYYEVIGKTNVDIIGNTLSMWKHHNFETIFTSDYVLSIQNPTGKGFGYIRRSFCMGVDVYFSPIIKNIPHKTPNYGTGK